MYIKIKWILSFLLLLPVTLLVLQFFVFNIPSIYALSENSYKYDHGCWVNTKPEIVILGSSMVRHGIISELITKQNKLQSGTVVNLAMNASTAFQNFITVKRNIKIIRSAKLVYYSLDPWMFHEYYYKSSFYERNFWNFKQYKVFSEEEGVANNYFFPIKLFMKNFTFRCNIANNKNYGYLAKKSWENIEPDHSSYDNVFQNNAIFSLSDQQFFYLQELKALIEDGGTKFIFVLTPKHQSWNNYYRKYTSFNNVFLDKFRQELGDVSVIGSFDPKQYNLNDSNFSDSSHLSGSGAEKFTTILFNKTSRHLKLKDKPLQLLQNY